MANIKLYDDNNRIIGLSPTNGDSSSSKQQIFVLTEGTNQAVKKIVDGNYTSLVDSSIDELCDALWNYPYTQIIYKSNSSSFTGIYCDAFHGNQYGFSKDNFTLTFRSISVDETVFGALTVENGAKTLIVNRSA